MPNTLIDSPLALYIKLGEAGSREKECIENGTLHLGYAELPHELCLAGRWQEAEQLALTFSKDRGAATRHINQVRRFYEEPPTTLWITFYGDTLWWCFAQARIDLLPGNTKLRHAIDGWHNCDVAGHPLRKFLLSGKLLATQGFQGTICAVADRDYLLRKINGIIEPRVAEAQQALLALAAALVPIIKRLHPKDLEILTDLIFRQAGWNRTGVAGGIERDIDLDLLSPLTNERVAVQIKSRASKQEYDDYRSKYSVMPGFKRFYFVTHSPTDELESAAKEEEDKTYIFWGPQKLAEYAARHGLVGWLIDKAN